MEQTRQICLAAAITTWMIPVYGQAPEGHAQATSAAWSLYFPVHMPGLELSQPLEDGEVVEIDADVLDLAKHANSFFALGARYDFHAFDRTMWLDLHGWYGGYGLDMDDLTAKSDITPPPVLNDLLDFNVDMQQAIVQGEWGVLPLEGWHKLDLGLTLGFRHYDQEIKVFGELPAWNPDCGLFGCFEAAPFRVKQASSWAEATLGILANYHWRPGSTLIGSYSRGSDESSRWQVINTFQFRNSWFASIGWRRDEFVNDGVEILEAGLYVDIGKRFE
jgi:hypothetical protein